MKLWSGEMQQERRKEVQSLHRRYCFHLYNDKGEFAMNRQHDWRGYLWHALSFLDGDEAHKAKANAMLMQVTAREGLRFFDGGHVDNFWGSAAIMILSHFRDKLAQDVEAVMLETLAGIVKSCSGVRFRGYNDNYPAMAALVTLTGAYLTGQPERVEQALENLEGLKRLLLRRGFLSEYTSPTYSPITLACLAEIVNLSPNKEARQLAGMAEERVWAEVASHFHKPTSFLAGPHSRAYMVDMCAHLHSFHILFYHVFGDTVFVNPKNAMLPYVEGQVLHGAVPEFIQTGAAWFTTPVYHVPDSAAELALNKQYPYTVSADSEMGAFPRNWCRTELHPETPTCEVQAASVHVQSYMEEDFALGTASRGFCEGSQTTVFHLVYQRNKPAKVLKDINTVFARYIVNDEEPSRDRHLADTGFAYAVSEGPSAMVLYTGRPSWNYNTPAFEKKPITSLKVSLIIPCFYGKPTEIRIGDRSFTEWNGMSETTDSIFIQDGAVFMAIHPLVKTDHGRDRVIGLSAVDGFGMIDLYNYRNPEGRVFEVSELYTGMNGFVMEVGSRTQWGDFERFIAARRQFEVYDVYDAEGDMREVRYSRDGLALGMMVSLLSGGIKYRTVNDRLVEEDRFKAAGFDSTQLPWY